MMRHWLLAGGMAIALGCGTMGWSAVAAQEEGAQQQPAEEEDVIIVVGKGKRDRAMAAFQAGDYETAEIEFKANLKCAERIEMLQEFAIEQSRYGSDLGPSGFGDQGGITMYNTPQETAGFYNNPRNADEIKERTCEEPAWQLYMIGLSQIQLGKYEEAKAAFYRVIALSRNEYLFDAHYRIALLEIMDGNLDKAEKRLDHLKVLQRRCRRKGERCEIDPQIDEVVAYLDKAVAESRAA